MALLRVHLGGVLVEVADPEDAVRLAVAYENREGARKRAPASEAPSPRRATARPKDPARIIFKNGHYPAFEEMVRAGQSGVSSEQLTNLLALPSAKSLPPTVSAWKKRAASIKIELDDVLEVDRGYHLGRPHTIYRLTPRGRDVFGVQSVEQEPAKQLEVWGLPVPPAKVG